ncbi:MAG: aldo/keto reductase [Promethearchaeota archaeon]
MVLNSLKLNNGIEIPILGLGTWMLSDKEAYQSVKWALDIGYRLIDTATIYGNERKIGEVLKETNIPRDELFITTKVWDTDQGYDSTLAAFGKSLKKLKIDYVDLYLIHWPAKKRNETWRALEYLYNEGWTRAIGVSNFTIRHLKELLKNSSTIPVINQVEFSPFLFQKELRDFCLAQNIQMEAYASLTRTQKFSNPTLKAIAEKYGKTSPQILIRWGIQHNIIQIPKSANLDHLKSNFDVFDFTISEEDMKKLNNLHEDYRIVTDPSTYP